MTRSSERTLKEAQALIWKKQLRTTLLLTLFIALCLATAFYLRARSERTTAVSTSEGDSVLQEVSDAVQRYETLQAGDAAALRDTADDSYAQKAELVFEGLGDESAMRSLLSALKQNDLSASFYITGEDATSGINSLSLIANAGYTIGLAYTDITGSMDASAAKRAVSDFVRTSATIQTITGVWPSQILSLSRPGEQMLAAAYACSVDTVIVPTKVVTTQEADSDISAKALLDGVERGSILCVKLVRGDGNAGTALASLCAALKATDLHAQAETMLAGTYETPDPLQRIYTTERAAMFTFSGLGNDMELSGVLSALKSINSKATFFLTRDELTRYPEEIQSILDGGHSLGISIQASRYSTALALLEELLLTRESIQTMYAYAAELPVRPTFGSASTLLIQACGAGKFKLLSSMLNAVRTEDIRETKASALIDSLLPAANGVLQRGEIVHFQMNQYQKSNTILGDLVKLIATERNIYNLKPVIEVADNPEYVYTYPLPDSAILPEVKDKIFPGQLSGNVITAISTRYIGVDWVATSAFLPGFSATEIKRLDKTGLVPNKYNYVFLTFDDWGTDKAITDLLDVLKAHKAKATFFIRTQNVVYNPNLLRAIAADGHTIGDHTHTHFPLSNDLGTGKKFSDLDDNEVQQLKEDLVTSYNLLQSIIGDLKSGTHPSLSLLFRPPTLAVSKAGLAAVFDCGFTYSVSGTYSSQDYKADNASKLAAQLLKNTKSGSVLVMHMSDTSVYTAEALDMYLSAAERKKQDQPFKFVGLSEVLQ